MIGQIRHLGVLTLLIFLYLISPVYAIDRFTPPTVTTNEALLGDSLLTIEKAWKMVWSGSPLISSLSSINDGAAARTIQAGLSPSPELGFELEEFGWDAPGLKESELSLSFSQELELFGKRKARLKIAQLEQSMIAFEGQLAIYDLYLETKLRCFRLANAQEQAELSAVSLELSNSIVATIKQRIENGAALPSELLLAQLEYQRAELALTEAQMNSQIAQVALASMWGDGKHNISMITPAEPDCERLVSKIPASIADSSRELITLDSQLKIKTAETQLVINESKPNLTLSSGIKRAVADRSNSFLLGFSLPLPFKNPNRGSINALEAEQQQLAFDRKMALNRSRAELSTGVTKLENIIRRHDLLERRLLPTAEEAYRTTQSLYQNGRLPYTSLLEANRSLVELRFEHNDLVLTLWEQIVELERMSGTLLLSNEDSTDD